MTEMERFQEAVSDFCFSEYMSTPLFEDMHEVGLLYSTIGEEEIPVSVTIDAINLTINVEGGKDLEYIDQDEYESLNDISNAIENSEFQDWYDWAADKVRMKLMMDDVRKSLEKFEENEPEAWGITDTEDLSDILIMENGAYDNQGEYRTFSINVDAKKGLAKLYVTDGNSSRAYNNLIHVEKFMNIEDLIYVFEEEKMDYWFEWAEEKIKEYF